jgi:triphosphatase
MQEQMLDHQQIEWQFEAVELALVEKWLQEHPSAAGVAVVPGWASDLTDIYYDTEDWRLYRAGYALRVRNTDGKSAEATMKALSPPEDGLRRRREISEPLEGVETPKGISGPVGERVRRLAGTAHLRPLFEVSTLRRTFALCTDTPCSGEIVEDTSGNIRPQNSEQDAIVAEIALDESEIFANGEATNLSRVEVEVGSDAVIHEGVRDFIEVLREALELRPTLISKFRTGLSVAGLSPAVALDLGPTEIDATLSCGEVAFAILRRHFAAMVAHEPGVRLGEDPEELHDMRVATRRLRAALKLYSDACPSGPNAMRETCDGQPWLWERCGIWTCISNGSLKRAPGTGRSWRRSTLSWGSGGSKPEGACLRRSIPTATSAWSQAFQEHCVAGPEPDPHCSHPGGCSGPPQGPLQEGPQGRQ